MLILPLATAGQTEPRYVGSRQVVLSFGSGQSIDRVQTWVSTADGRAWSPAACERVGDGAVSYLAESEGRYGFYLVLENQAGRSAEPPVAGVVPHIVVIVDTAPPTLQIRHAKAAGSGAEAGIDFRLTLIEENLGPSGLRLFYRAGPDESWIDGGPLLVPARSPDVAEARVYWPRPARVAVAERIDILLVCTDRAGNTAREEIRGVLTTAPSAAGNKSATQSPDMSALDRPRSSDSALPAPAESSSTKAGNISRAEEMRALAARFVSEGRYDLAAARFSDALAAGPNDPQVLTEFGAALVRSNRLEEARTRFESALSAAPRNTAALEGLALVALGQRRLPDARDNLKRALEIDRGAGRVWLRYGDVEYRLGNQAAAFDAWKTAGAIGDPQLQSTVRERLKSLQR